MRTRLLVLGVLLVGAVVATAGNAAAGGGGCHTPPVTEPERTTTVVMKDFCITPSVVQVQVGDTVEFANDDPVLHNLYGTSFSYGDLQPGARATHTFDEAGTYTYACTLHPGMTGAVVVGDLSLIAESAPLDGSGGLSGAAIGGLVTGALVFLAVGWAAGRLLRPAGDV